MHMTVSGSQKTMMSNPYSITAFHGMVTFTCILVLLFILLLVLFGSFLYEEYNKSCDNCGCKDTEWCHVCYDEGDKSEWIPKEDD